MFGVEIHISHKNTILVSIKNMKKQIVYIRWLITVISHLFTFDTHAINDQTKVLKMQVPLYLFDSSLTCIIFATLLPGYANVFSSPSLNGFLQTK